MLIVDHAGPFYVSLVCGHQVIATRPGDASSELVFELEPETLKKLRSTLALRLQDEATGNAPIAARARLDLGTTMGTGHEADESGEVTVVAPTSGLYTLVVEAPGYASVEKVLELGAGALRKETVRLRPAATIDGRVVRLEGEPASGRIYCHEPSSMETPRLSERRHFPLSADGSFRVQDVPAGPLNLVLVTHDGLRAARTVDRSSGNVEEVVFEIPKTYPVLLRVAEGTVAGGTYTVLDFEERPVWSGSVSPGEIIDLRLAAGAYTALLRRHAPGTRVESAAPFHVGKDADPWVTLPGGTR